MLVEIHSKDNGSGCNTNLDVYLSYNEQQKLFDLKPYCRIDESDFADLLTDSQVEAMYEGKIHFKVSKAALNEKANKIYSNY